jgi:hypothetical protein
MNMTPPPVPSLGTVVVVVGPLLVGVVVVVTEHTWSPSCLQAGMKTLLQARFD